MDTNENTTPEENKEEVMPEMTPTEGAPAEMTPEETIEEGEATAM